MNILVTGSTGLVGTAFISSLEQQGHTVLRLLRKPGNQKGEVLWAPPQRGPELSALEGLDAVVHLAGESIAERWTEKKKKAIRDSRVQGTQLLVKTLVQLKAPPKVFLCASAIGYYGNHGSEIYKEGAAPDSGYLGRVCQEWESATAPAAQKGIRVVNLRFGIILSPKGGALAKMLLPFKMGVGGKIASGQQYMSWIALDDVVGAMVWALKNESLKGPVNIVAPKAATNEEFTKALGRALHRPTLFPMPAFAAKLAFGEMGEALLIGGVRVEPAALLQSGFTFRYPDIDGALKHLVGDTTHSS